MKKQQQKTLQEILLEENNIPEKKKNIFKRIQESLMNIHKEELKDKEQIKGEEATDLDSETKITSEDIDNDVVDQVKDEEATDLDSETKITSDSEKQPGYVLIKEKITGTTKEVAKPSKFKKVIAIGATIIGLASIVLIAKSCSDSNVKQNNNISDDNSNNNSIVQEDNSNTSNNSEIMIPGTNDTESKEESKDELKDFATIKYITKEEIVTLFKNAEKEFEGTSVTTEELAAFVTEINKTSINSELKEILISSGVISVNEELNRQNYLNTIDKIRNSMINAYTIEVDPELVGMPEYDALIEELKANAVKVNISNLVVKDTKEYEMYKLLDETYNKIGQSKTLEEAKEAYEPVLEYVNSENSKNMPNNMEEEIYKDLYKDAYDEITAAKYNVSITEVDRVYFYEEETECVKTLVK